MREITGSDVMVLVESDSLVSLPGHYPETTAFMLFGENRRSRVNARDFPRLQFMEYLSSAIPRGGRNAIPAAGLPPAFGQVVSTY